MFSSLPTFTCDAALRRFTLITLLLIFSPPTLANQSDIWAASQGDPWFYEVGTNNGAPLAGSWWEGRLEPGKTYQISFEVTRLRGVLGLHLGNRAEPYRISEPGDYLYAFSVPQSGDRKLMFTALGLGTLQGPEPMAAGVQKIRVQLLSTTNGPDPDPEPGPPAGGNPQPPGYVDEAQRKGHYWFFSRERNLKTELLDWLDGSNKRTDSYYVRVAEGLDKALRTPGIKGFGVHIDWKTMEPRDGQFNFKLIEDNLAAARRYGLRMIVKVQDRSFDNRNIMPPYFAPKYVLRSSGMGRVGFVAKRYDPYVYTRLLRINKAIIARFGNDPGFGGLASTETALGADSMPGYSLAAYQKALVHITNGTLAVLPDHAEYFFYLNFLPSGVNRDMNLDSRSKLLDQLNRGRMVVGGPDITPDIKGMPGSLTSARLHMRRTEPELGQFCHMQHVDHGLGGRNKKSNKVRQPYLNWVNQITSSGFRSRSGAAVYLDDLRNRSGQRINLHPQSELGKLWSLPELFAFGQRNFKCDWMFWHYRENLRNRVNDQSYWPDSQRVILNNQYFYEQN